MSDNRLFLLPNTRLGKEKINTASLSDYGHSFMSWMKFYGWALLGFFIVGALLSRAFLLGELMPFGVAFLAAALLVGRSYGLAVFVGALYGLCTVTTGLELGMRTAVLIGVSAVALALPCGIAGIRIWLGGLVFAANLFIGASYTAFTGPNTYDYVKVLFESVFIALLAVSYLTALTDAPRLLKERKINGEQALCLVILLLSLVAAAGQISWGIISPGGILAALAVLAAGYIGGAGLGAAAGAVVGMVPGLVFTVSPAALGAFAFAGFLGGLCRGVSRLGVTGGFLLGSTLLIVYLGSSRDIAGLMLETALAGLIFMLLPGKIWAALQKIVFIGYPWTDTEQTGEDSFEHKVNRLGRFKRWENVFDEVSYTYDQANDFLAPGSEKARWQAAIESSGEEIRNMVCNGCTLSKVCWEREALVTLKQLENCFARAQKGERINLDDIKGNLRQRCLKLKELITALSYCYRIWRMREYLGQRLKESHELISVQLKGMGGVVERLISEMEAGNDLWRQRADYLKQSLKEGGVSVAELILYPAERGCELEMALPNCNGRKVCLYDAAPLLKDLLCRQNEEDLTLPCRDCVNWSGDDFCSFRLYPNLTYQMSLGAADCAALGSTVSGDNYELLYLPEGQLAVLISDGMGSGPEAAKSSKTALSLLKQLVTAGYSRDLAVRMVNLVMMRRSPEEDNFATMDMCVANLYEGTVEFIKIGASPTFWVRNGLVRTIKASSLPVGIVDDINIYSKKVTFNRGDMLIMATDGVCGAHPDTDENQIWIASVLREIVDLPPQEVADLILRLALSSAANSRQADDMTVLAIKFI